MKFNITAGSHKALVVLEPDGKGAFAITYLSDDYGNGSGAGLVTGDHYIGVVTIKGHKPDFDATITGSAIKGTLTLWPFPALHFEGAGTT